MVETKKKWRYKPLGELAKVQSGGTPSRGNKDYWDGQIPWVKISDISGLYVSNTEEKISELGLLNSSATLFPKGTILFTIFATIGKVGVLSIDATTNQAIAGITPNDEIDPKFLTYALIELAFSVGNKGKGVAQKNINLTILKSTEIPLPSMNDQKRIVQKLDKLFAHLEKIKERLDQIPELLKQFRQAVLTQAVTGKLTEEWRKGKVLDDNKLLNELSQHHLTHGGHKKGNAAKPDIEKHSTSFANLPKNWGLIDLRDLCLHDRPITYGILMPGPEIPNGIPYLKVMSYPNDKIDFSKVRHTSEEVEELYKRARLNEGDIVMSIRGTVGRVIIIPKELDGANITQDSARISLQPIINNIYISYCLQSPVIQDVMDSLTKGVAVRGINIGDVRHLKIPIPAIEEQVEIVRQVKFVFSKTDSIEQRYKKLKEQIDQLQPALLAKAFRGELGY